MAAFDSAAFDSAAFDTGSAGGITPDNGALVGASFAPTIAQPISVTPSTATGSLTSDVPGLTQTANQSLLPGGAASSLFSLAPSITQSIVTNVTPGVDAVSMSAYAPSIAQTANTFLSPGAAALAAMAAAPMIAQGGAQSAQTIMAAMTMAAGAPGVSQAPMPPDPRYARPISDISPGTWTPSAGASLANMINEQTADDETFISTSAASVCRVKLAPVVTPAPGSGQVMRYRAGSSTGNGLYVRLMQGSTLIVQWAHAPLPAADTTFTQTLTTAQCAAITDYTNLFLEFEAF